MVLVSVSTSICAAIRALRKRSFPIVYLHHPNWGLFKYSTKRPEKSSYIVQKSQQLRYPSFGFSDMAEMQHECNRTRMECMTGTTNKSEVARFREQQAQAEEAAWLALNGYAEVAKHKRIIACMELGAQ